MPASRVFCEKVTFDLNDPAYPYPDPDGDNTAVFLYSLSSRPLLMEHDTFFFSKRLTREDFDTRENFDGNAFHKSFYLPKGSYINVSACAVNYNNIPVTWATFWVLKGYRHLRPQYRREVTASCETSINTYSYSVESDDFYSLVLASNIADGIFNYSHYIYRTRYVMNKKSVIEQCYQNTVFRNYKACGIGLPLWKKTTTVLKFGGPEYYPNGTYWPSIVVGCSRRTWMYVVVILAVLVGATGVWILFSVFVYRLCKKIEIPADVGVNNISVNTPLLWDQAKLNNQQNSASSNGNPTRLQDCTNIVTNNLNTNVSDSI